MHRYLTLLVVLCLLGGAQLLPAPDRNPTENPQKPGPQKSGFYSFQNPFTPFEVGVGAVSNFSCMVSAATQPGVYAGNSLLDCDAEVPHNETTIAVNPNDPDHVVGGYHSYELNFVGRTLVSHIISTASVSFDGGVTWQESVPPVTPYQFMGDPALAFDSTGRLYYANIADHEGGKNFPFTGPSIVVSHSNDGGLTWSNPVTVEKGLGAATPGRFIGNQIFNDKEFIAVDTGAASPHQNRVYVTWSRFEEAINPGNVLIRVPIAVSFSDNGLNWSARQEISGFSPNCSVGLFGLPNECDLNQDSYPTVAPTGKAYVTFENFNTPAENQILAVSSNNGGQTWSAPVKVDDVFDINLPTNLDGRSTVTGCQFRWSAVANSAADPSDATGNTVYVVWSDNRNGGPTDEDPTNTDVFLGRSTDGGLNWTVYTIDDTANDQFYPWVAVAPDGRVDVGYMDRSWSAEDQADACEYGFTLRRMTFGGGGAINLGPRTRVDTGLSDAGHVRWFSFSTNGNTLFLGDYNGVAVGPDGATWSLWTDHRALVANPPSPNRNHGQHAVGTRTSP